MNSLKILLTTLFVLSIKLGYAQKKNIVRYELTINDTLVNISGENKKALAINGKIPAPTLNFTEGDFAEIVVHNKLKASTSSHWHGLILPNLQDGVPYLTTPPILPNTSYTYRFPLKHSGTYWYHSHTGLQEQKGLYGAIVVKPKKQVLDYDKELIVVLSDWTDEKSANVMRNLKRHNEWYAVKRNTPQPLLPSIRKGLLKERLILYANRMPDMHIADIYYNAFLANGMKTATYDNFKPGEKVRIRVVNAAASTYFWLNSSNQLQVISSDGIDIEPILMEKVLISVAETYDFLLTIPDEGQIEIKASAQDGSGNTSVFLGKGNKILAPDIPKPDYFELMKKVAILHGKGGHTGHLKEPYLKLIEPKSDMEPDGEMIHANHDMQEDNSDRMEMNQNDHNHHMNKDSLSIDSEQMNHSDYMAQEPNVTTDFSYDFLKAKEKTKFPNTRTVREISMNLNADMLRYVWTINGKTLSEDDRIKIKKGEVVRFIMNNNTMMHHPMHLHGHFFRVLNDKGEYSPLKHTVDVPPFESTTIEFDANEEGDWFFHCHILYHMVAGMSRVVTYDTPRNPALKGFPYSKIFEKDKRYFHLPSATLMSNMAGLEYNITNTRNEFIVDAEYGWNKNYEAEISYEYYIGKFLRAYTAINSENSLPDDLNSNTVVGKAGIRYRLLSILDSGLTLDTKVRPELNLDWHISILKRLTLTGHYESNSDFNILNSLEDGTSYELEQTLQIGFVYLLNKYLSITINYDNRFGTGAGLRIIY